MIDLFVRYISDLLKILVTYVIVWTGLPSLIVLIAVIAITALIGLIMFSLVAGAGLLALKYVFKYLIAPIWRLGGSLSKRICWAMFIWLKWAVSNWRWVFPPFTLLLWGLPGVIVVPLVGALFSTLTDLHFFWGFLFGSWIYNIILMFLLMIGLNFDGERKYEQWLKKTAAEEGRY